MKVLLALFMFIPLYSATSFITKEEYAASLYHNPRGIGCNLCHGEAGKGKHIASYKDKGVPKVFDGKPINTIPFPLFYERINSKIIGMPRYYLTDVEIQTLYYYLHREELRRAAVKSNRPK